MFSPIKDVAKELKVSERFLRQLVSEGRIPFYRLSARTLRFDLSEIKDYMRLVAEGKQSVEEKRADG